MLLLIYGYAKMQIGLGFAFAYPQFSTLENYCRSSLMCFFVLKTFVRLLLHCRIPFDENQYHFWYFLFWLYKAIYSTFIFVSNGDSLDWRNLNCEQMLERIIPKTQSGDILLFHNGTAHTAESLDKILTELGKFLGCLYHM